VVDVAVVVLGDHVEVAVEHRGRMDAGDVLAACRMRHEIRLEERVGVADRTLPVEGVQDA